MSGLRSGGKCPHINWLGSGTVAAVFICVILILTVLIVKIKYKQKVGSGNSERATGCKCPISTQRAGGHLFQCDDEGRRVDCNSFGLMVR